MIDFINSDFLRWVNVGMSSLIVVLLIMGTMHRWEQMPLRIKRIVPWVICTYLIVAYGSAEIAWSEVPAPQGYRVLLIALDMLGMIIALLYRFGEADYEEK